MPMIALVLVTLISQAGPALQPGDILENGGGEQVKVLRCKPTAYSWRECETVAWKNGAPDSNPAWWNENDLIKTDTRVREALGKPPRGGEAAAGPARGAEAQPRKAVAAPAPQRAPASAPVTGGKRIPDGTYKCMTWIGSSYVSMGTLRSVNNSLDTGFLAKVGATFTGATPTAQGVTISYTTRSGYRESMDCARQ